MDTQPHSVTRAPNLFAALPGDVLEELGACMSKADRTSLKRAAPGLQYDKKQGVWAKDRLYDFMVPKGLQDDALDGTQALGAGPRQRAWAQLWHRLHAASKAKSFSQVPPLARAKGVGCVRVTLRHDIQTVLPLPELGEVLTLGHMPRRADVQRGIRRQGQTFPLAQGFTGVPPTQPTQRAAAPQAGSTWTGEDIAISKHWCQPKQLVRAGRNGLFASLDQDGDVLKIWQYEGQALMPLVFADPDFVVRATAVTFYTVGEAPRSIFHGSFAYGAYSPMEHITLHGVNICPPGPISSGPYLELEQGLVDHDAPACARHLGVDETDKTVLLVGDSGEVVSQRLPLRPGQPAVERDTLIGDVAQTCTSAQNNAVALCDRRGHVRVLRKRDQTLQLAWTLPKPQRVKKMALNADGSRVALLNANHELDIWSTAPRPVDARKAPAKLCRISFAGEAIDDFVFSPSCHALLVTSPTATRVVFPLPKQFAFELPHMKGTGQFMPGMLRIMGVQDNTLVDIDLAAPPAARPHS